jgi:hypothetical protein
MHNGKAGPRARLFRGKARSSAVFTTFEGDFGLVTGTLLPKVRSLPDESMRSGFLMEGKY